MHKKGRRDFVLDMLPYSYSKKCLEECSENAAKIVSTLKLPSHSTILDVQSGGGHHAAPLSARGMKVTALDPFAEVTECAKKRWSSFSIDWVTQDLHSFKKNDSFNLILNLGHHFGIDQEKPQYMAMLENFYFSLAPGGQIAFQLIGRDILEKYFQPKFWIEESDGSYLLNERKIDYDTGHLEENFFHIKGDNILSYCYTQKLFYPLEIMQHLETVGFTNICFHSNLKGDPYNDRAECLFVTAEKIIRDNNRFIRC